MIVEKEFFIRNSLCCTAANNNNSCNVHTVVPGLIMEQNKKKHITIKRELHIMVRNIISQCERGPLLSITAHILSLSRF